MPRTCISRCVLSATGFAYQGFRVQGAKLAPANACGPVHEAGLSDLGRSMKGLQEANASAIPEQKSSRPSGRVLCQCQPSNFAFSCWLQLNRQHHAATGHICKQCSHIETRGPKPFLGLILAARHIPEHALSLPHHGLPTPSPHSQRACSWNCTQEVGHIGFPQG